MSQAAPPVRDVTPTRGRQGTTELLHRQGGRQGGELQALLQRPARQAPQHQAGGEHVPGARRVGDRRRHSGAPLLLARVLVDGVCPADPVGHHGEGNAFGEFAHRQVGGVRPGVGHGLHGVGGEGPAVPQRSQIRRIPATGGVETDVGEQDGAAGPQLVPPVGLTAEIDHRGARRRGGQDVGGQRLRQFVAVSDHRAIPLDGDGHRQRGVEVVVAGRGGQVDVLLLQEGFPDPVRVGVVAETRHQARAQPQPSQRRRQVRDAPRAGTESRAPQLLARFGNARQPGEDDVEEDGSRGDDVQRRIVVAADGGQRVEAPTAFAELLGMGWLGHVQDGSFRRLGVETASGTTIGQRTDAVELPVNADRSSRWQRLGHPRNRGFNR